MYRRLGPVRPRSRGAGPSPHQEPGHAPPTARRRPPHQGLRGPGRSRRASRGLRPARTGRLHQPHALHPLRRRLCPRIDGCVVVREQGRPFPGRKEQAGRRGSRGEAEGMERQPRRGPAPSGRVARPAGDRAALAQPGPDLRDRAGVPRLPDEGRAPARRLGGGAPD
ncbi:MAG: hypothetical protein M0C28_27110 [Candidatus Moduliflexus flocculans]|nr:hypothetical protein [Candidatus Moduliflexus flocculans]